MGTKVMAIVVTYKRRELLRRCLDALGTQTTAPDRIVVVENAGLDGTLEMLDRDYPGVEVIRHPTNLGGAGGWETGIRRAQEGTWDFVWLMDDDAWATPDALQRLLESYPTIQPPPAFVCSRVVDDQGATVNFPHPALDNRSPGGWDRYLVSGYVPLKACSFVSVLIPLEHTREVGLPLGHYFLWTDDYEYTLRLGACGTGWYISTSLVSHPRPGGLPNPDLALEPNEARLPLYRHLFRNYVETMARHPRHHRHWVLHSLRLVLDVGLAVIRQRRFKRLPLLVSSVGIGIWRGWKVRRR